MVEATLSKIGNSMGVLLPKSLRIEAALDADQPLRIESPRKGVVVITSVCDDRDRLSILEEAQGRIESRMKRVKKWPENMSAQDMLQKGKDRVADELLPL